MNSVSYSGQVFRQVLINDVKAYVGDLTGRIDTLTFVPQAGDVKNDLMGFYDFDSSTSGGLPHMVSTDPATDQVTYDDISSDKNLTGKMAGNDGNDHKDWSAEFVGWPHPDVTTPESLVLHWFDAVDAQSVEWVAGRYPLDPSGAPVPGVHVSPEGLDYQQLLEKFIRGALSFSQGADDYLDEGLGSDHSEMKEGKNYTALEHAWDEGFGYFGAARTYATWSDDQIADDKYVDVDMSGGIDLNSEMCVGHSVNAAKRDRGSASSAPNDFTAQAWDGFYDGRLLITNATTTLTADEMTTLEGHRDMAVDAWEKAISSTVVHYINDVIQDMNTMQGGSYDFGTHAKHWGEMKGFALSFQFNPRSPMSDADFAAMHDLMRAAPVLQDAPSSARDQYIQDLIAARALIGDAYGFDAANLGDANGENGW
jgi:hypothetical protein